MRKRIALVFAAATVAALGFTGAHAERIDTPIGSVGVNDSGYLVYADGNASNPDPVDGHISVSSSGKACADDNGGPTDPTNPNGTSPSCTP